LDPDRSALDRLGYELRRWRLSRQLSQKELGRRIVFTRVHVSLVETAQERPSRQFVERCDAVLEAGGALLAIYEQVRAEHARARVEVPELRPAGSPLHLPTEEALDVLELARQAEASSLGAGTVETIDRAVDRFCREYPGTAPHLLIPSVGRRLGYISQLLRGRLTLTQHRALLVAGGWLTGLLACLQFDVGNLGTQALTSERNSGVTLGRVAELDAALLRDHADVSEVQELHEQYLLARRALGQVPVR
jgi:transcriptional regulator with XRE-family HTH domain